MSLIGNVGRWHGKLPKSEATDQHLRNELNYHFDRITEWLRKRQEAAAMIAQHRKLVRDLHQEMKRRGMKL